MPRTFVLLTFTAVALVVLCAGGCRIEADRQARSIPDSLAMEWTPVGSLNARLPEGVRVFAGKDEQVPLRAWYVRIDEADPNITTRVVVSDEPDRRETVSAFAEETEACVAVNGGYFHTDTDPAAHVGMLVTRDSIWEPPGRSLVRDGRRVRVSRPALGFVGDGEIHIGEVRAEDSTLWPEPSGDTGGTPQPVREALGAGPLLVRAGTTAVTDREKVIFGARMPEVHPRTAAGVTADGALILMVVDGRQPASRGVSLEELAALMREVGAVAALNLDGGGSSALVVDGILVNRPQGGTTQREVMSALVTSCL